MGVSRQALNQARDDMLTESRRRNDTERFLNIELENNNQLRSRIEHARRDLTSTTQKLVDAQQQNTDFTSEVTLASYPQARIAAQSRHCCPKNMYEKFSQNVGTLHDDSSPRNYQGRSDGGI